MAKVPSGNLLWGKGEMGVCSSRIMTTNPTVHSPQILQERSVCPGSAVVPDLFFTLTTITKSLMQTEQLRDSAQAYLHFPEDFWKP